MCSLRVLFLQQAKKFNQLFKSYELLEEEKQYLRIEESIGKTQRTEAKVETELPGLTNGVELIKSKWRYVPNEIKEKMDKAVIMVNGLYVFEDFLAIIYGWNVPEKAKRSWDLMDKREMGELSSMCLTYNADISRKILDIWEEWNYKGEYDWNKIYNKEKFKIELQKNHIECYDYREPLILAKKI